MRVTFAGFVAGVFTATAAWAAWTRTRAEIPVSADAESQAARPATQTRRELEARLESLKAQIAAGPAAAAGDPSRPPADGDVTRWIMDALAGDGPMSGDEDRAERWINGLLEWVADDRGINQADLEFGPLRERFIVDFLKTHGQPLDPEQRKKFEEFLGQAEEAFAQHLSATAGLADEERLISGLRATKDWEDRMAEILTPAQLSAIAPLGVLLDQWRWIPACEPRLIDPDQGFDAALEAARGRLNPGDYDRARPILVDHVTELIAMHREVEDARLEDRSAVSDVDEFIRYLEIRIKTRKRLIDDVHLRPEDIPPGFLMDYGASRKVDEE